MTDRANNPNIPVPLFVDLDGTLIKSDLLFEGFFGLLKLNIFYVFMVLFWFFRGKSYLKSQIAKRVNIDPALLPYNLSFLNFLRDEVDRGRPLVLATASNEKFAKRIADYLGIFSCVLASGENLNLSGKNKLKMIINKNGGSVFDYAGNAKADLEIFRYSRAIILVNPERGVEAAAGKIAEIQQVIRENDGGLFVYLKALRVHQWMKNMLLFVPLLTAHQWFNPMLIFDTVIAFISFSICVSGVYLFNDLLDLPSDRAHPRKRLRPFAAGQIPATHGLILLLLLPLIGMGLATTLSLKFMAILLTYLLISLAYSAYLKTYVLIDVLVLAGLYTIRIIAGAIATGIVLSFWLLAFSIFIFFSLALVKRCSELVELIDKKTGSIRGRDYNVCDFNMLQSIGIASGCLSVLVVAFYVNSQDVIIHYSHPQVLWMICPTLLYWIGRMWLKTGRGEMHDDPLVYSMRDRGSQFILFLFFLIVIIAT